MSTHLLWCTSQAFVFIKTMDRMSGTMVNMMICMPVDYIPIILTFNKPFICPQACRETQGIQEMSGKKKNPIKKKKSVL